MLFAPKSNHGPIVLKKRPELICPVAPSGLFSGPSLKSKTVPVSRDAAYTPLQDSYRVRNEKENTSTAKIFTDFYHPDHTVHNETLASQNKTQQSKITVLDYSLE
jgi:hypothetical protein